jgi:hypothetical protein
MNLAQLVADLYGKTDVYREGIGFSQSKDD